MTGLELTLKGVKPVTKGLEWLRNKISKNYTMHQILDEMGLGANKKDFNDLYHKALGKMEDNTHPEIISLFANAQVKDAFMDDFYGKAHSSTLFDRIGAEVNLEAKYELLKESIHKDIQLMQELLLEQVLDSMTPRERYIDNRLDRIEQLLLANQQPSVTIEISEASRLLNADFDGDIQDIIEQIAKKQNRAAIDLLKRFNDRKGRQLTDDQKYKIHVNIGVALFELGEGNQAAKYFIDLPTYKPDSSEALGLAAMGYAIQEDCVRSESFVQQALSINPGSTHAVVARLLCLPVDAPISSLEALIPPNLLKDPMIGLSTAIFLNAHPYPNRQRALQILEGIDGGIPANSLPHFEIIELKAIILTTKVISDYISIGKVTNDQMKKDLNQAITWFTEAWDYYKGNDLRPTKWHVLTNRGVAHKLLQQYREAERDFYSSLDIKREFFSYHHLLSLNFEQGTQNLDLISTIRQNLSLSTQQQEELFFIEAAELLGLNKYDEVLALTEKDMKFEEPQADSKINFYRIHALLGKDEKDNALTLAFKFAQDHPSDPYANYLAAETAFNCQQEEISIQYLDKAFAALPTLPPLVLIDLLSGMYTALGKHDKVIRLLNKEGFKKAVSVYSLRLLNSLMIEKRFDEAFKIAEPLYDETNPDPLVGSIILEQHEQKGDIESAYNLASSLSKIFADDPYFQGKVLAQLLKRDKIKEANDNVTVLTSKFDISKTFEILSNAAIWGSHKSVIPSMDFAYILRNKHHQELEAHRGYVRFMQALVQNGYEEFSMQTVEPGARLQLQTNTGEYTFIIIDDTGSIQNAYPSTSEVGKDLLGRTLFESFILNRVSHTITSISSKYHTAYLDSAERLKTSQMQSK